MFIRHVLRHAPATGALAASLALTGAGPVLAAGDAHRAVVQPDPVAPGEEFSVFDGGNCPGGSGEATFDGAGIPTMKLSPLRNQVGGTGRVPESAEPGSYKVTVVCGQGGQDGGHGGHGGAGSGHDGGSGHRPGARQGDGGLVPQSDPGAADPGAPTTDGGLPGGDLPDGTFPGSGTPPGDGLPGAGDGAPGAGDGVPLAPGDGTLRTPGDGGSAASGEALLPGDGAAGAPADPGGAAGAGRPAAGPVDGRAASAGTAGAGTARAVAAVRPGGAVPTTGGDDRGHGEATLTGTLTVVAADHGLLPKGGSDTGLGGAAGTGLGTTALGGALLAGAIGWGVVDHRRRSREENPD
ncbi:hypothetical protein [Streptomyces sp. NPDC059080]|uniref:hypothetical protein n=1 Tax=Streptomyces sp. NPDC059080 TaxID=3346718 RepID=UPI0036A352AB